MKKYFCSFILIFYCSLLEAQPQLSFEKIQPEKFTSPFIKGMLQDKEGYLWFGSINGVYRFDGFNLKPFLFDRTKAKNLTRGYVYVIYEDSKNNLWVGSTSGLNKLNPHTGDFEPYVPEPGGGHVFKNYVWSVTEDSRGVLWVGVMGLYYLDQKTNKLKAVKFPEHLQILNNVSFESMCEDKNGIMWFGTSIGLFRFDPEKEAWKGVFVDPEPGKLAEKNWNTGDYSAPSIYKDEKGILWIGTFGGKLLKLDPDSEELTEYILTFPGVFEPYPVQAITSENSNELWLGTYLGLVLFDKITGTIKANYRLDENDPSSLSDDQIRSVLKDKSGTLWVGTSFAGLNKVNRTVFPFKRITNKPWMKDKVYNIITYNDFTVSRSGTLLVGTSQGITEIKHNQTGMISSEPYKAINVLMEDSKRNLWIGLRQVSGGGILKKDPAGVLHQIVDSSGNPLTKEVHCFYESRRGYVYVGNEFMLIEVNPEKNSYTMVFQAKARIYTINEDNDGNLLIGTMIGGLYLFDPIKKIQMNHFLNVDNDPSTIIDNSISDIYRDRKQRIWVSTSLGLCLYNPVTKSFKRFHQQGTIEAVIVTLEEDNSGRIWMGMFNGITCFNPETGTFKNYDISYGMHEGHHYSSGKFNGIIYMKARAGITYFDPDEVVDNTFIPPVRITEMKVFDKSYPVRDEIELSYSENYLSFEFAALSFISPEKNSYAYKMEGVDKDWINSFGRRYAAYTDLKPGKYVFYVKASNNDGVWNNKGTSLSITILPPWWQTYWAFGLYAVLLILLLYAWRKYDLKRQTLKFQLHREQEYASKLQEISDMKSRFFTNISHEFRTPITLILGPADRILSEDFHPESQKQAGLIKRNALRLLGLINQLLDISKLDDNKLKLKVSYGNIVSFIKGITMIFESLAESKDIILFVKSDKDEIRGYFDKEILEKVFINIFSNAFKFTPTGGKIYAAVSELNNKVIIKVKDTGVGIPEKELPKLFDRFYQVDNSHTREYGGTGIGLALTKELVELHKGNISVQSKTGEGSEFTIELSLGRDYYDKEQIVTDTSEHNETEIKMLSDQFNANLADSFSLSSAEDNQHKLNEENGNEKMILLIVEDNSDVREYIKGAMNKDFLIEEAANGEQGVRKAQMIIPDLIIGDIMMPKMDGFAMTRILKQDEKTNHIPIILLTAKSDQESKFEGLEAGADDYLIKPFNIRELNLRVTNLINIRKKLQERFSAGHPLPIPSPQIKHPLNAVNEAFMLKVINIVQKHIDEEDFTIEDFGNEVGMSRTQLHRKLTAITGKSASRYIRSFRLNTAREMIRQQKGNISEIAYSVGFSSPPYFSKCFKEEFGYPPSALVNTE